MGLRDLSLASLRKLAKALGVSMDDLMTDQQEKLRRLKAAEVLREAAFGGRTRPWFEGALPDHPDPYVADATKALEEAGLIAETTDHRSYRATQRGRQFLKGERTRRSAVDHPGSDDRLSVGQRGAPVRLAQPGAWAHTPTVSRRREWTRRS